MSVYSLMQWLSKREWAGDFAGSTHFYPAVLATHLCCIALFGGMILITDLRLLDWAFKDFPVSQLIGKFRIWKRVGFVIMITAGFLLGGSEADKYYPNPYFWTKMILLILLGVHALAFRPGVYLNTAELDRAPAMPARAKLAGALSLILWVSIVCMGRMIGYYETPRPEQAQFSPGSQAAQVISQSVTH